jgi:hypothetical protein
MFLANAVDSGWLAMWGLEAYHKGQNAGGNVIEF